VRPKAPLALLTCHASSYRGVGKGNDDDESVPWLATVGAMEDVVVVAVALVGPGVDCGGSAGEDGDTGAVVVLVAFLLVGIPGEPATLVLAKPSSGIQRLPITVTSPLLLWAIPPTSKASDHRESPVLSTKPAGAVVPAVEVDVVLVVVLLVAVVLVESWSFFGT